MSVQIRVTGAAVSMRKRRRHHAADVHLPDALWSLPGEQCVLIEELECVVDGRLVGAFNLCGDLRIGDRPQR
jgi:hypothetical protein